MRESPDTLLAQRLAVSSWRDRRGAPL